MSLLLQTGRVTGRRLLFEYHCTNSPSTGSFHLSSHRYTAVRWRGLSHVEETVIFFQSMAFLVIFDLIQTMGGLDLWQYSAGKTSILLLNPHKRGKISWTMNGIGYNPDRCFETFGALGPSDLVKVWTSYRVSCSKSRLILMVFWCIQPC